MSNGSLRLLTFDNAPDVPAIDAGYSHVCKGYTCDDPLCVAERADRAARGVKAPPPQPWQTKRAA